MANIKINVDSDSGSAPLADGMQYPNGNKMGGLFVADWRTQLALAGRCYSLDLGAGGTALAGNAAFDADQPEFLIGADTGFLIPISLQLGVSCDADAEESITVELIGDRSQCQAAGATATAETPVNLLDGGPSWTGGRAYSVVTGNITAPVETDMLFNHVFKAIQVDASGTLDAAINITYDWNVPVFLAGACQIVGYVYGSATATAFSGRLVVAHIPSNWIDVP